MSAGRLHLLKVSGLWGRLHRAESETLAGLLCSDSPGTPVGTRAVFRHLLFQVDATLADATRHGKPLGHASNYGPSWAFGRKVRHAGLDGVHFSSVRAAEGHCLALFAERAVAFLRVEFGAVIVEWDGAVSHRIA